MITGRFKDIDLIIKINLEKDKGIINIDISQKISLDIFLLGVNFIG